VGQPIEEVDGEIYGAVGAVSAHAGSMDPAAIDILHVGARVLATIVQMDLRLVGVNKRATRAEEQAMLDRARDHLGLDVLFVGRWERGQRIFEYVSAVRDLKTSLTGRADPLEQTYCLPIVNGEVARFIPDAQLEPSVQGIALTHDMGIGVHLGSPLHLPDGSLYGTICGAVLRPTTRSTPAMRRSSTS
jgi:hypothetical protein